jgi:hypothetical protein
MVPGALPLPDELPFSSSGIKASLRNPEA